MAAAGGNNPTMLDVAKRMNPDGSVETEIAEMMALVDPIVADMPMIECNDGTSHTGVIRTGLPTPAWRLLNYGTSPTKSKTKQIKDATGILEDWGEIDEEVFNLNGAKDSFRMTEDEAHIEGMAQEISATLFYGNTQVDPEKFLGLAPRFSLTTAENGGQIILGGGSGSDNTSLWYINWDRMILHGLYPATTMAGLKFENLGIETKEDAAGSSTRLMRVIRTHFIQKMGIHLKDWKGVVRIANLDISDMAAGTVDLTKLLVQAWYKVPLRLRNRGRGVFYCNPTTKEALVNRVRSNDTSNQLTIDVLENGIQLLKFWGIPIKECDSILNTETLVA